MQHSNITCLLQWLQKTYRINVPVKIEWKPGKFEYDDDTSPTGMIDGMIDFNNEGATITLYQESRRQEFILCHEYAHLLTAILNQNKEVGSDTPELEKYLDELAEFMLEEYRKEQLLKAVVGMQVAPRIP